MTNSALSKTCSVCGLQKSLSAFLELTGSQGTTYGNVCSACRRAQGKEQPREADETTRRETGGAKLGVTERTERLEQSLEAKLRDEELAKDERDKVEELKTERIEKTQTAVDAKKRAQSGTRSFLDSHRKTQIAFSQEIFNAQNQEKQVDVSTAAPDTRVSKVKYEQSPFFKEYLNRVKGSAPIAARQTKEAAQKAQTEKNESAKDAALDHIEKTWGPSLKRR